MKQLALLLAIVLWWGCDKTPEESGEKAYVALQGADKIGIVDVTNGKLLKTLDVDFQSTGDLPHYIVIDKESGTWYTTLISSGYIVKFDLESNSLVDSVYIGNQPALMALDKTNQLLYISRFMPTPGIIGTDSREIHRIDVTTMTVTGTVDVGALSPHGIALTQDGTTLWVASNQASHLFRIETSRFNETGYQPDHFKVGTNVPSDYSINDAIYAPLEVELSADESKVFVSCSNSNEVREFDAATGELQRIFEVGQNPWHMAVSLDGQFLYVSNRLSNSVSKIVLANETVSDFTDPLFATLQGCALTGEEDKLVVTSAGGNRLHILNTATMELLHTVSFESVYADNAMPTGVAVAK